MGIGARLRGAREGAGLTIRDLSARTKIQPPLLDAIERGDFARLPGGPVRRGFLRAFAREVGLDPESIVREYLDEFERDGTESRATRPPISESADVPSAGASRLWSWLAAGAAVGLLMLMSHFRADAPPPPLDLDAIPASGISWTEPFGGPDVARADFTGALPGGRAAEWLILDITPTGDTWIEAIADGERVVYRLVGAGEHVRLNARDDLVLRIGNAGALRYSINGEHGRALGNPGQVIDLRITRDNYRAFLASSFTSP